MRSSTVISLALFVAAAIAAPIDDKRGLNTVISKYADVGKADVGVPTLNTVISAYSDVEATATENRRDASPVQPAKEIKTLDTVIHHYADVEGNVY